MIYWFSKDTFSHPNHFSIVGYLYSSPNIYNDLFILDFVFKYLVPKTIEPLSFKLCYDIVKHLLKITSP